MQNKLGSDGRRVERGPSFMPQGLLETGPQLVGRVQTEGAERLTECYTVVAIACVICDPSLVAFLSNHITKSPGRWPLRNVQKSPPESKVE